MFARKFRTAILFFPVFFIAIFLALPQTSAGEQKEIYTTRLKALERILAEMSDSIPEDNRIVIDDLLSGAKKSAKEGKYKFANRILDEIFKILYRGKVEDREADYRRDLALTGGSSTPPPDNLALVNRTVEEVKYTFDPSKPMKGVLTVKEKQMKLSLQKELPLLEYQFKKHPTPENAEKLKSARRVYYYLKKKELGYDVSLEEKD